MKTNLFLTIVLFLLINQSLFSISYTSAGSGPADWNNSNSWIPAGIPLSTDDVTILAGHTVTISSATGYCKNLSVEGVLNFPSTLGINIYGNYTVNGSETGNGGITFNGSASQTITISGTGSFSLTTSWQLRKNVIISPEVIVSKTKKTYINNVDIRNFGNVTLSLMQIASGATWIQEANSNLTLTGGNKDFFTGINQNIGTFDASASGNTVTVNYYDCEIPNTIGGVYHNLVLTNGGTKKILQNTIINGDLTITRTNNNQNNFNTNGFDLLIKGNYNKLSGGHLTCGTNKVTFGGTTPQNISLAGSIQTFSNLFINNPSGVTLLSGACQLSDVLTISNGTFTKGGTAATTFTLLSTATKTARIAEIGNGGFLGNFTVQRYITARDTTWSCMASPVLSTTVQDWDNELFIYYSTDPFQATVQSYDESIADYTPVSSAATSVSPMQGFEVYLTASTSLTNISNITLNTIGVPNFGDQSMALSYTDGTGYEGQNLVGNPFASSIDWSTVFSASTNIDNFADVFDYTTGNYANVNLGDEIGLGQGFWVYALGAGATLNIPESAKTSSSNSSLRKAELPVFNLSIASANGAHTYAHKLELMTDASYSMQKDMNDRAYRMSPNRKAPKITSLINGKEFVRNAFYSEQSIITLPLSVSVGIDGKYTITANNIEQLGGDYTCVVLKDNKTGQYINLTETGAYAFIATNKDATDRFELQLSKNGDCRSMNSAIASDIENEVLILPTNNGNSIAFNFSETLNTKVSVTNMLGQSIVETFNIQANTQTIELGIPADFTGMYIITISNEQGMVSKKFVKK